MSEVLIATETVLLVLLSGLVLALLRSHAEILRRLEALGDGAAVPKPARRAGGTSAAPVAGTSPAGDALLLAFEPGGPESLLAFLSSGCASCRHLLETLPGAPRALPGIERLIVVTKGAEEEIPARFRDVAAAGLVVMSSQAWERYSVPGSPYFVHVDGTTGTVVGEGSAPTWERVASLLGDASDDARGGRDAPHRVDAELAEAGLEAGDPSLYPSRSG